MKEPFFSVIVPIYNAEQYLNKCIDSILSQTFTNFELLLIDDGSTDSSGKICDDYAYKYSCIQTIHKPNGGVSSARNCGIEHSLGTYIVFVDADDWVDNDYLECLYSKTNEDLICCSFIVEDNTNNNGANWNVLLDDSHNSTKALNMNLTKFSFCSATCKAFKASIIKKKYIFFNKGLTQCEDGIFVLDFLSTSHCSIKTQSKIAYHYRWDNKRRNTYINFPMSQSYKLMDLLSYRLIQIHKLYKCSNVQYLQCEMTCSQFYNIYRTIKEKKSNIIWKAKEFMRLFRNKHVRNLLTDKSFMKMRHGGCIVYYLMRLFYAII